MRCAAAPGRRRLQHYLAGRAELHARSGDRVRLAIARSPIENTKTMTHQRSTEEFLTLWRIVGALALVGSMASCSSPEQRYANEVARQDRANQEAIVREHAQEAQLERIRVRCLQYGFAPQSSELAKCVQTEMQSLRASSDAWQRNATLVAQCKQAMTLRGSSFGAAMVNATKCDTDPYAHLRESKVNCVRNFDGSVTCTAQ